MRHKNISCIFSTEPWLEAQKSPEMDMEIHFFTGTHSGGRVPLDVYCAEPCGAKVVAHAPKHYWQLST